MRKQFVNTVESLFEVDEKIVLLLGDIGVFGFRNIFKKYKNRIYNIGILEQTMISVASGLSKEGFHPVVHSIAPFVVERSLEQIKLDTSYQSYPINIVSVGASYDYAALGCSHHCPGDISSLLTVPSLNIFVPGCQLDFDALFRQSYNSKFPNYFRLSENSHDIKVPTPKKGYASKIKNGSKGIIIAVGPMLKSVLLASVNLDVTILYYTSIIPFDKKIIKDNLVNIDKISIVEPFYEGTISHLVLDSIDLKPVSILNIGVLREFLTNYGKSKDHDEFLGLDPKNLKLKFNNFFNEK